MIDMDLARAIVAQREQKRIDALVDAEAANESHRRAMAVTGQQMRESQERIRAQKIAVHEAAVVEARTALDALKLLRREREAIENKIGFLRADLAATRKNISRCTPPSRDDFPLPSELAEHKRRRGELENEEFRLQAMISNAAREYEDAARAETEGETVFERAKSLEWTANNDL